MKMKKEYCKPDTRYVLVGPYFMLMVSNNDVTTGGGAGNSTDPDPGNNFGFGRSVRDGFWEDIDEDLLEDISKEEISELE